jgi:hypothetical protein
MGDSNEQQIQVSVIVHFRLNVSSLEGPDQEIWGKTLEFGRFHSRQWPQYRAGPNYFLELKKIKINIKLY